MSNWDGITERRADGAKIDVLVERVNNLIKTTDEIKVKVDKLPCDMRSGWYESIRRQVNVMWLFLGGIISVVILEWIKNGKK